MAIIMTEYIKLQRMFYELRVLILKSLIKALLFTFKNICKIFCRKTKLIKCLARKYNGITTKMSTADNKFIFPK